MSRPRRSKGRSRIPAAAVSSDRLPLGIDLGTTNTCVALVADDPAGTVLPNAEGELTTPSAVYFAPDGEVAVGRDAIDEIERDRGRVVTHIKRDMGKDGHAVEIAGARWYPQQVSAMILRKVVLDALTHLGHDLPADGPLADVVITVPAYFGSAERQATWDAGRFAGLNVLDIINEPTAAAVAHGLRSAGDERTVLVYDLGGGTFDVTIVRISPQEFRVAATLGDHRLGGADWDARLTELVLDKLDEEGLDIAALRTEPEVMGGLVLQVERVKIALSREPEVRFDVRDADGRSATVTVSREEYEEATESLMDRTLDITRDLLHEARSKGVVRVDDVLLAGGMARSPAVAGSLVAAFPELPVPHLARDAEHIVARGAARMAAGTIHRSAASTAYPPPSGGRVIRDVTAKGYGVVVVRDFHRPEDGRTLFWLIKPNTEVPARRQDVLRTVHHDQRRMAIRVYESMTDVLSDDLAEHVPLVDGDLAGLPAGLRKGHEVRLDFDLGADGILRIRAYDGNGADLRLEARVSGQMPPEAEVEPLPAIRR
jgi:molecular chaperone DnaK